MATQKAMLAALAILEDVGMIRPAQDSTRQARTWLGLLVADTSDQLLAEAVKRLVSGQIETYWAVKPDDLNRAARAVRAERVRAWLGRHEPPTEGRTAYAQSAYLRGFHRAIGDGATAVEADRHGRAAAQVAAQVAAAEPDVPLPELLARLDAAIAAGKTPWLRALPSPRALPEAPPPTPGQAERVRATIANLTNRQGSHPTRTTPQQRGEAPRSAEQPLPGTGCQGENSVPKSNALPTPKEITS